MDTLLTFIHEHLSTLVIIVPLLLLITLIVLVEYLDDRPNNTRWIRRDDGRRSECRKWI